VAQTLEIAHMVLMVTAAPVLFAAGYLGLLALLSRRSPAPRHGLDASRFDLVVPAHDEAAGIAATVTSLLELDWPAAQRRVLVVADNCSDDTAERARAAGATVLERQDATRRGKGYALAIAFDRCLADAFADAVVVVDADTLVSPNLLRAFASRLEAGALAQQARYGVRNPEASWRTRLMALAFALFHDVRSLGRERLGLSAGLRGNGMCFAIGLLRQVPHQAFSVVEDLEYGIRLGLAGHRVHYVDEAAAVGEMPSGDRASASQRRRWEGGRAAMVRRYAGPLLGRGLLRRDAVLVDLALDLLVPPLSRLLAVASAGSALALGLTWWMGSTPAAAWLWWASLASLGFYVARGCVVSGLGLRGVTSLAWAPLYMLWRLRVAPPPAPELAWDRTPREPAP
jgi:1,2-diacylglycerol 3-beta-glucosyltransferase